MGYRLALVVCAMLFVCGCSAFENDGNAIEGFGDLDVATPTIQKEMGPNTGYYAGAMTLDSNTCQSVSDETGTESTMSVDIIEDNAILNATFEGGINASSTLEGGKATFMTEISGVKHVYYFTFKEGVIEGKAEVIEADEAGQYGDPCASYMLLLNKGEKPAVETEKKGEEKK